MAKANDLHIGDDVAMTFPETGEQHFTVAAIYAVKDPLGDYVVSHTALAANVARVTDSYVLVTNSPGVSSGTVRAAMTTALADNPAARLNTVEEFTQSIKAQINKMLNLIYVLLFLAVVIALFGIANTLALSVVERRRELGLLRAVGMQRSQVRAGVRWEAALIALLGVTLGTVLGLGFGWVTMQVMASEGLGRDGGPGDAGSASWWSSRRSPRWSPRPCLLVVPLGSTCCRPSPADAWHDQSRGAPGPDGPGAPSLRESQVARVAEEQVAGVVAEAVVQLPRCRIGFGAVGEPRRFARRSPSGRRCGRTRRRARARASRPRCAAHLRARSPGRRGARRAPARSTNPPVPARISATPGGVGAGVLGEHQACRGPR